MPAQARRLAPRFVGSGIWEGGFNKIGKGSCASRRTRTCTALMGRSWHKGGTAAVRLYCVYSYELDGADIEGSRGFVGRVDFAFSTTMVWPLSQEEVVNLESTEVRSTKGPCHCSHGHTHSSVWPVRWGRNLQGGSATYVWGTRIQHHTEQLLDELVIGFTTSPGERRAGARRKTDISAYAVRSLSLFRRFGTIQVAYCCHLL